MDNALRDVQPFLLALYIVNWYNGAKESPSNQYQILMGEGEGQQKQIKIVLGDAGEHNPYHLFFYMLARFKHVDNGSNEIEYYYPNKKNCYISEAALSALPPRFKRRLEKEEGVEYREIYPVMCGDDFLFDKSAYSYLRDLYKPIWQDVKRQKGKYTYISRSKAALKSRQILNEYYYLDELRRLGFSIYNMEDLTFEDQIRLFRSSEIITGPHGAAMCFGLFCEENTVLCEIHPTMEKKGHFADLSRSCGLRFFRFAEIKYFNEATHDMVIDHKKYIESIKRLVEYVKVQG